MRSSAAVRDDDPVKGDARILRLDRDRKSKGTYPRNPPGIEPKRLATNAFPPRADISAGRPLISTLGSSPSATKCSRAPTSRSRANFGLHRHRRCERPCRKAPATNACPPGAHGAISRAKLDGTPHGYDRAAPFGYSLPEEKLSFRTFFPPPPSEPKSSRFVHMHLLCGLRGRVRRPSTGISELHHPSGQPGRTYSVFGVSY
jgi:hypothetical protein